jgi:CheY-like chemotaxis protein
MSPSSPTIDKVFSILIIEDDKNLADMLVQIIESYFSYIKISVAYSGFEAGDLLHSLKPDLVILDLIMPGIDGFSICHRIKNTPSTQHIDVIAMTGALTEENVKRISLLGADECFGKPLDYDLVKQVITKIMNNKNKRFSKSY